KFPTMINFFNSFFFGKNNTIIDKSKINDNTYVDWGAGSFLMIKISRYCEISGFDENYFMYCEDIDLCYRYTKCYDDSLLFIPSVIALHDFRKDSHKILSKHFFWHVKSLMYYMLRRHFYNYKVKSRVR
ncbi:TPA: glycosyltransferase family 2 protein, partial [Citrobacter freundii]